MSAHVRMPGETWCKGCGKPYPCPTAERDRLAAAIKAIPRHRRGNDPCTYGACMVCAAPWPCPTENVRAALAALDADA